MQNNQIEIVTLEAKHFVGVPVTNVFKRFDKGSINEANRLFLERKIEIKRVLNEHQYVCPHFANDVLFTYIYCMEVENIEDIPKGMIGFTVDSQSYAKVRAVDQDPYVLIKTFLKENDLKNNTLALALEVFKFGEEQHFNNADIFVPILQGE
ncbi:GyrI-like domain-containing protein [Paenibacillus sp. NPDC058174]|uniref:GyrI-like domain-containing protein n=1 Tax=Paenibacillus sp. NPDC058174 TaxID=3346366 RepID=UPI0036DCED1B